MHFGDRNDIDTKDRLAILMRNHRFHGKDLPTQKQLDAAWFHLKNIGTIQEERPVYRETVVITEETPYYGYPEEPIILQVKGFKKRQVRSKKTGRILGWIDYYYLQVKGFKKRQVRSKKTGRILGWID